jgi:hypothetical protein
MNDACLTWYSLLCLNGPVGCSRLRHDRDEAYSNAVETQYLASSNQHLVDAAQIQKRTSVLSVDETQDIASLQGANGR